MHSVRRGSAHQSKLKAVLRALSSQEFRQSGAALLAMLSAFKYRRPRVALLDLQFHRIPVPPRAAVRRARRSLLKLERTDLGMVRPGWMRKGD
jgi:hypothetical protein